MGTGAVVCAGDGRGTAWIWRVLRVEVRATSFGLRANRPTAAQPEWFAPSSQLVAPATENCSYAESHTFDHPLHAAHRRALSPVRPKGEQRRDSLDCEHLRPRRLPDLVAAGADVLGAAQHPGTIQIPRRRS